MIDSSLNRKSASCLIYLVLLRCYVWECQPAHGNVGCVRANPRSRRGASKQVCNLDCTASGFEGVEREEYTWIRAWIDHGKNSGVDRSRQTNQLVRMYSQPALSLKCKIYFKTVTERQVTRRMGERRKKVYFSKKRDYGRYYVACRLYFSRENIIL